MSTGFFGDIKPMKYEGPDRPTRSPTGSTIRTRRCWASGWRTICASPSPTGILFAWPGGDPFGGQTFERPWFPRGVRTRWKLAKLKADVAFEMFTLLGVPYYCFHDADVRPEGQGFFRKRGPA
jgi:xylose isomerase